MKIISVILLIFLSCAILYAQDEKKSEKNVSGSFQITGECGDHLLGRQGNFYESSDGKIIEIVDGNTVIFESVNENGDKEEITVNLAGIEDSDSAKSFLEKNLLNKNVRVMGWISKEIGENRIAVIYNKIGKLSEVNCFMITNGIAQYKKFKGNDIVPDYKNYYYAEAEEKAKEAKLGIWKTNPGGFSINNCSECGCDGATPSRWDIIRGEVISIKNNNAIIVKAESKTYTIELIGVDTSSNKEKFLLFCNKNS